MLNTLTRIDHNNIRKKILWLLSLLIQLFVPIKYAGIMTISLGVIIALQGFYFLLKPDAVNFYLSLPVTPARRFRSVYVSGLLVFFVPFIISCLVHINSLGLFLIPQILLFLGVYNISIFALMISGRIGWAVILSLGLLFYVNAWEYLVDIYSRYFLKTLCTKYVGLKSGIGILDIYTYLCTIIAKEDAFTNQIPQMIFGVVKMLLWILLFAYLAYSNYKKRPAESAGVTVAFYSSRVLIKLAVLIPGALIIGINIFSSTNYNYSLMMTAFVVCVIVANFLLECAFFFRIKTALKHCGAVFTSLILVFGIFLGFRFDVFGYDRYTPEQNDLSTFAFLNQKEVEYSDHIEYDDGQIKYIDPYQYAKNNMYCVDVEAIISLAHKSLGKRIEDMEHPVRLDVLYRLKNGREKARTIWVDTADGDNDEQLNRLVGPAYYKEGVWQATTTDIPKELKIDEVNFDDGKKTYGLNAKDAQLLIEIWRADMVTYDYSCVRYDKECGYITIKLDDEYSWILPVYDRFAGVMDYLKRNIRYTPIPKDERTPAHSGWVFT